MEFKSDEEKKTLLELANSHPELPPGYVRPARSSVSFQTAGIELTPHYLFRCFVSTGCIQDQRYLYGSHAGWAVPASLARQREYPGSRLQYHVISVATPALCRPY